MNAGKSYCYSYPHSSCARSRKKFNAFSVNCSRPIQDPSSSQSFHIIQPYWYSRKRHTDL